jgi:hypothetical protein
MAEDLDGACTPLLAQLRARRVVSEEQLAATVPTDHTDAYAWLSCYGQLRVWLVQVPAEATEHAQADALVTRALRDAPVLLPQIGDGIAVYPKSFETLLQLHVLNVQMDRLTARLAQLTSDGAPIDAVDTVVGVATATAYVQQLIAWAWCTPGSGLPFAATEAQPVVPAWVVALTPSELLAIAQAAHAFLETLGALQALIDPIPARDGGRRPSWSALFEAMGAEVHADPRELAVTYSLGKVLAMTRLASDRLRPMESAA